MTKVDEGDFTGEDAEVVAVNVVVVEAVSFHGGHHDGDDGHGIPPSKKKMHVL
jgi:hypothetical protein